MIRQSKLSTPYVFMYFLGLIPVVWLGIITAPCLGGEFIDMLVKLTNAINKPFKFILVEDTLKCVLFFIGIYLFALLIYITTAKKYRKGEEHGSAKWGNPNQVNRKYQAPKNYNKILTQNVQIGIDGRKHRRNLNVLVVGGAGSGKTRFYAKPNIMQCNTSFVCLDPKGELLRDTGNLLLKKGYKLKVLDLLNMNRSLCYNPFVYLHSDNDIQKLVTNLFKNTTPKGANPPDPFWEKSAQTLLLALMFHLYYEAPIEEQNFPMVMEMIRAGDVKEDDEEYLSPLDILFKRLEVKNSEHIALKYYLDYAGNPGKTKKNIKSSLTSHLEKFNLSNVESLTQTDEMELETMGEVKTALFAIIPDNDTSFNFLVGMLYTQLFQALFYSADFKHNGRLPIHVHFIMDEFANIALPDDFDKLLSTMRSREISVSIILQNLSQLKALFKDSWESIVGNCDEFLYLGGNEQSTHKYVSELLGKETIDTNTYGKSQGKNGSYSTNYQNSARELLDSSEIRLVDNKYAMLFIRGELPIIDLKFDILSHKNIKLSADGDGKSYNHGATNNVVATLDFDKKYLAEAKEITPEINENEYIVWTDEDDLKQIIKEIED